MVFPGVLRGRPGPRLATIPTSRPRRSLSSPGMSTAGSVAAARRRLGAIGAVRRGVSVRRPPRPWRTKNDADRATLRNLLGRARRLDFVGGAASHLSGLAL